MFSSALPVPFADSIDVFADAVHNDPIHLPKALIEIVGSTQIELLSKATLDLAAFEERGAVSPLLNKLFQRAICLSQADAIIRRHDRHMEPCH